MLLAHCENVFELQEQLRHTRAVGVLAQSLKIPSAISEVIRTYSAPTVDALDEFLEFMHHGAIVAKATAIRHLGLDRDNSIWASFAGRVYLTVKSARADGSRSD